MLSIKQTKNLGKVVVLCLVFGWGYSYKPILRSPEILSVRNLGMGWAYTAIANDESILNSNPAGIGIRKKFFQNEDHDSLFYFLPIKFGYSENIFHSLVTGKGISSYWNVDKNNITYSVEAFSPTDFVYAGSFWAFSFITRSYLNIFNESGFDNIHFQFKAFSQIKTGFKIFGSSILSDRDFHVAIAVKTMYLIQVEKHKSNQEVIEESSNLDSVTNRQELANIYGGAINFFEGFAVGLDIGILWEIHIGDSGHQINLGVMVEDAPSYGFSVDIATDKIMDLAFPPFCNYLRNYYSDGSNTEELCNYNSEIFNGSESTFFQVNGKIGIAYMLPDYWGGFFSDTIVAFDVHRIGDLEYSFADMYHVGISSTIFDMASPRSGYSYRLNLSVGVSQNQFNAGYLVHLNKYQIGYNYSREKFLANSKVSPRHVFTFAVYF